MLRRVFITLAFILLGGTFVVGFFLGLWILGDIQAYGREGKTIWEWVLAHRTLTAGVVGALVMLSGVSIGWWQLNTMRRTRYAELLLRLSEVWDSEPYIKSRHRVNELISGAGNKEQRKINLCQKLKDFEKEGREDFLTLIRLPNFLETLAFLVEQRYLPLNEVRQTFGPAMVFYYEQFSTFIAEAQKEKGKGEAYKGLQKVVRKL